MLHHTAMISVLLHVDIDWDYLVISYSITTERHKAEVRRCVNDEKLSTLAFQYVSYVCLPIIGLLTYPQSV